VAVAEWGTLMGMETHADHGLDITIVVPVYNEIDNSGPLIDRVRATLDGTGLAWEFLAVDDGSTDGSGERLDELARSEARIRVLHFQANCGQSAGLDAGFKMARGRLVALLDADLQTYPEDLPKLIEMLESEKHDAVVGIRAERHDSGWKRFSSRFANGVRNRLTREDIQDTGCPIKVFRAEAIRSVKMFTGMHRFLPTLLRMEGYTVKQVPVRHTERTAGTSKYGTWDRAFSGLRDALAVRWMQDRHMRWKLRD
jgi:glycosyltransferase involved in cell wall biosynthesis